MEVRWSMTVLYSAMKIDLTSLITLSSPEYFKPSSDASKHSLRCSQG